MPANGPSVGTLKWPMLDRWTFVHTINSCISSGIRQRRLLICKRMVCLLEKLPQCLQMTLPLRAKIQMRKGSGDSSRWG
jgi:hypothetical protein